MISIIGIGNMGGAFATSVVNTGAVRPEDLVLIDRDSKTLEKYRNFHGSVLSTEIDERIQNCSIVIIAVKPQDMELPLRMLRGKISKDTLIVSVMAGVSIAKISNYLNGHTNILRCMPNLGVITGSGISVYFAPSTVTSEHCKTIEAVFSSSGKVLKVATEQLVDAATAISGSGPAYVSFFIEEMQRAATNLGFSEQEAALLVNQTFAGTLDLLKIDGQTPSNLRRNVTSKGGTTEAAFKLFNERSLGEVIKLGILHAYNRAREISTAN